MKTISLIHSILYLLCKVEWTDPHKKTKQKQNWHPNPVISFSFDTLTNILSKPLCNPWTIKSKM